MIFDYFSPADFKFAGIDVSNNKIVVGHRASSEWAVGPSANIQLKPDTLYNVLVVVNGTNVTVRVDGAKTFSHTFAARALYGQELGLNQGMVGVGPDSTRGSFDNVAVQVLPPQLTFELHRDVRRRRREPVQRRAGGGPGRRYHRQRP